MATLRQRLDDVVAAVEVQASYGAVLLSATQVCREGERDTEAFVGNVLQALANARWSKETGFYGDYQGPTTVRFRQLTIAGEGEQG